MTSATVPTPSPEPTTAGRPWLNVAAKLVSTALSFAFYVALARAMAPADFATVALTWTWLAIGVAIASLSMPIVTVRHVAASLAEGHPDLARGMFRFGGAVALAASMTLAGLWLALDHLWPTLWPAALRPALLLMAALLPPTTLLTVVAGQMQALKHVTASEVLVNLARPLFMLTLIAIAWQAGRWPLPAHPVLGAYLGVTIAVLVGAWTFARMRWPPAIARSTPRYESRAWWRSATGYMLTMLASAMNERVDMLMLGWTSTAEEVAKYAVAGRFAQTLLIIAGAVPAVLAPLLVERLAELRRGDGRALEAMIRANARSGLRLLALAWLAFAVASPFLHLLFGAHYAGARWPLMVLVSGQVVAALFGPAMMVATLCDAPRIATLSLCGGMLINATTNAVLAPALGATGAALATAVGAVAAPLLAWAWTRRRLGVDTSVFGSSPFSRTGKELS